MIESLFATLVVAAVSGLTLLAYKHPNAFKRLSVPLMIGTSIVFCVCIAWNMGIEFSEVRISKIEDASQYLPEINKALVDLKVPYGWLFFTYFAFHGYLAFLVYIPELLTHGDD